MSIKHRALIALVSLLILGGCASTQRVTDSHKVAHCEKLKKHDTRVQQSLSANNVDRAELAFHEPPQSAGPSTHYVQGASSYQLAEGDIHDAYVDHTFACRSAAAQAHDPLHGGDGQPAPSVPEPVTSM